MGRAREFAVDRGLTTVDRWNADAFDSFHRELAEVADAAGRPYSASTQHIHFRNLWQGTPGRRGSRVRVPIAAHLRDACSRGRRRAARGPARHGHQTFAMTMRYLEATDDDLIAAWKRRLDWPHGRYSPIPSTSGVSTRTRITWAAL